MRALTIAHLFATLVLSVSATAEALPFPQTIGSDTVVRLVEEPRTWNPGTMYEHVNGEAELLQRYGAVRLINAYYENGQDAYLSVDILDMGVPINSFGLYRLYAGCENEEYEISGATVLPGEFTSYALFGRYFMRIDLDTGENGGDGRSMVEEFLSHFSRAVPAPKPLPAPAERLKMVARKPCELGYHPEHVDYDLDSGPGYTWIGPDGGTYFMVFFQSPDEAAEHAAVLRSRGAAVVLAWGNAVTWPKVRTEETSRYLKGVLRRVVKW